MSAIWTWITKGIAHLIAAFKTAAGPITAKILATLGLTMVSFQVILPQMKAFVVQYMTGLPGEALSFLGYLGVGKAMAMVFSALTIRMASKMMILPKSVADNIGTGTP